MVPAIEWHKPEDTRFTMEEYLMRTKTYLIVSFLVLAALLTGCAGAAFAQTETPADQGDEAKVTRTVTVTGSGKVYLTPDIAYITIGVHTEGEDADEAVGSTNAQAHGGMAALLVRG